MKSERKLFLKVSLIYLLMCIIATLLCLIGLIWNNYYVALSCLFGTVGGYLNMLLLIIFGHSVIPSKDSKSNKSKGGLAALLYFGRMLLMGVFLVLSWLVVFLTLGDKSKNYYFSIISCGLPYIFATVCLALLSNDKAKIQEKNENSVILEKEEEINKKKIENDNIAEEKSKDFSETKEKSFLEENEINTKDETKSSSSSNQEKENA